MPPSPVEKIQQWLKDFVVFMGSRRVIPMLKGTLAYALVLILVFIRKFDSLSPIPVNFANIIVIAVVGQPGRPIGVCWQQTGLSLLGVCLGTALFALLAVMGHAPVAQGVVFALIVYVLTLVKARGILWYPFSLLAIFTGFNGIFTSLSLDGTLHIDQLIESIKPYLWAVAVNLVVNLLIFPKSSEKDFRETLVLALDHISELSTLLGQAYALSGSEEDRLRRIALAKVLQDDFGLITLKIEETSFELNWSKYSLEDYRVFVCKIRAIQAAMITAHTTLTSLEEKDIDIFRTHFLPHTQVHFTKLQQDVIQTIQEMKLALSGKPIPIAQDSSPDVEKQAAPPSSSTGKEGANPCAAFLARDFIAFRDSQHKVLTDLLCQGGAHGCSNSTLHLLEPGLSPLDQYGADATRGKIAADLDLISLAAKRRFEAKRAAQQLLQSQVLPKDRKEGKEKEKEDENACDKLYQEESAAVRTHWSLIRVYSVLYAFDRFIHNVTDLHSSVMAPRRPAIRLHIFELFHRQFQKPPGATLTLKHAMAILEDRPYTPAPKSHWDWFKHLREFLAGHDSIFAGKTAAAALVFATLLLADTTRNFFITYQLSVGLLTAIVAMGPTLGQAIIFLVLQVLGAVLGALWGLAVLEMFRGVGGYQFNPYGMTCLLVAFALPFQFLVYERPMCFVLALLAMNAAGVLVIIQWVFVEQLGVPNFDTPSLMTGRAITVQCIALVLVVVFQVFILRTPARRLAREALARVVYGNLSYHTMLQAYIRAVLPVDSGNIICSEALSVVRCGLEHRERQLQADIIALDPLIMFAVAEPEMGHRFPVEAYNRIIYASQAILDRMRDARDSLGAEPFPDYIIENYSSVLSPYRRRATQLTTTAFYLTAASLTSMTPLPHHVPGSGGMLHDFIHDSMLLSTQCAQTRLGADAIANGQFIRCWFHLMCVTAIPTYLQTIELACKEMYGELEDDPKLK